MIIPKFFVDRGGKICLTDHFKPLWARNVPKFGISHAMALGVSGRLYTDINSLKNIGVTYPYSWKYFPSLQTIKSN